MSAQIPSAEQIGALLRAMTLAQVREVSHKSGIPYRTLLNIRFGATPNPGLETVRRFYPYLDASAISSQASQQAQPSEQEA